MDSPIDSTDLEQLNAQLHRVTRAIARAKHSGSKMVGMRVEDLEMVQKLVAERTQAPTANDASTLTEAEAGYFLLSNGFAINPCEDSQGTYYQVKSPQQKLIQKRSLVQIAKYVTRNP